ncbi:PREDICTED: coiled-coil domain-containing protein 150-like [Branchiostoma belcheri]|uniref:Coiled-coil domain-containing protein 150-like n=1 Tax=Branchiostoma belcheri TaxID=7741 RepID=A0A6P4ZL48_BRABE|nr:PREDICTED: coiled-coil domain-containing protein 150-like [Branchiostoma belcheri]
MEVSKNLQDAHEWFKSKFDNLQTELDKSRKTQETLQRATLESRFALQEERLKADEQAEKAKQMIRESRKKITRLADYLEADSRDRSRDTSQRDRFDRLGIL